jgi:hypothetical protein
MGPLVLCISFGWCIGSLNNGKDNMRKAIMSKEGIAIILLLASVITNPLTGQYINQGIDWVFTQMFLYGAYISLVTAVYLIGLMVYLYIKSTKVNIPKSKKSTAKFLET